MTKLRSITGGKPGGGRASLKAPAEFGPVEREAWDEVAAEVVRDRGGAPLRVSDRIALRAYATAIGMHARLQRELQTLPSLLTTGSKEAGKLHPLVAESGRQLKLARAALRVLRLDTAADAVAAGGTLDDDDFPDLG